MLASATQAAGMQFKADLKGASEVPPTTSSGTGMLTASYDPATKTLTWSRLLLGPHRPGHRRPFPRLRRSREKCRRGRLDFREGSTVLKPVQCSATLTDAQAADLQKGMWYVNVHTAANPGGELRGQLMKS